MEYCTSPLKKKGLCDDCKRDIKIWEMNNETKILPDPIVTVVKNLKTKKNVWKCEKKIKKD